MTEMPSPAATDTIAAIATAPGRGAIGVLRLSGPDATTIAAQIVGPLPQPRVAALRDFLDAERMIVDSGLVLVFPAPHSFTGENVVELQGHGGPVVLSLLLAAACRLGARAARPGEFSERAFLNDRLDLAQAEAIADLIDAGSAAAVRAASRSLHGEFSRRIGVLVEALIALRADLEAALDFSDEDDVPWLNGETLGRRLTQLGADLNQLLSLAAQGRRLREGLNVAIVGQPNVGKSTLLNRLSGTESAIVSAIPGTTRDLLREHVIVDGLPLNLVDTAGLRETSDVIEQEGVRRAWAALTTVEVVLYVIDDVIGLTEVDHAFLQKIETPETILLLRNKCDTSARPAGHFVENDWPGLRLSAAGGMGLDLLVGELKRIAGLGNTEEGLFSARTRHLQALTVALRHIDAATINAAHRASPELVAEELRLAQQSLDEITGRFTSEDLLGRIFSSFCIGK